MRRMVPRGKLRRLVFGHSAGIAGTVYGTIIVMATIAAGARTAEDHPWELAAAVAVSVIVLWIAHVYSNTLAESLQRGRRLDFAEFRALARHELAMPGAAIAPVAALVLGALDVLAIRTAMWLALGLGVATLAVQGARYAALERLSRPATVVSIALNVSLGLVIVVLKALITH
jgi:cell division protein FtsW (lipid II flippase)